MIAAPVFEFGAAWLVRAAGWALLNSVWQVAACSAGLLVCDVLLIRSRPQVRYLLACLALALSLALPLQSFLLCAGHRPVAALQVSETGSPSPASVATVLSVPEVPKTAEEGVRAVRTLVASNLVPFARDAQPWMVGLWALGAGLLSLRLLFGWLLARGLGRVGIFRDLTEWNSTVERIAARMKVSPLVRLCESARVEVPTVVGWLKPAILFPAGLVSGMSPPEIEALLAHELAHIRRYDYLVNLLQAGAEALLYHHPAAWWISSRIRAEREHCCDDEAAAACGGALAYGKALARLELLRGHAPRLLPAATGGCLLQRIRRLAGQPVPVAPRPAVAALVGLTALLALLAGAAASSAPAVRQLARAYAAPAARLASWARSEAPDPGLPSARSAAAHSAAAAVLARTASRAASAASEAFAREAELSGPAASAARFPDETLAEMFQAGISAAVIAGLEQAGYGNLDADDVTGMQQAGVTPEYARAMNRALGRVLGADQLIELHQAGVDGSYASEVCAAGRAALDPDALIELRNAGVDAEFVAQLRALGYGSLPADDWVELRSSGVTPAYISALKALGIESLTAGQLIQLRSSDVTPDFLRRLRRDGYEGSSVEEIIQLRERGDAVGAASLGSTNFM